MLLQVRELDSARKYLLLKIQAQSNIVFEMLDSTLGQIHAMNLQDPVVVDHPPQERSRVNSAFPEVDRPLGREKTFGEFIFVFRDRLFVFCRRRYGESSPSLRALVCRDRYVDDGGRRVWPQIDPGILVNFRHDQIDDREASAELN